MTTKTVGYTSKEMFDFGFYDWTVIATRPATAEEAKYGCTVDAECGCCSCHEEAVAVITVARPRWSRSGKRMVDDVQTDYVCEAHA